MSAIRTIYVCGECGETSPKWLGKCIACGAWNSYVEDAVDHKTFKNIELEAQDVISVSARKGTGKKAFVSGITEFDRVLGGGIAPDGFTLLTGDPGIGKSTLALQVAGKVAATGKKVLYITGEESVSQVGARAERLGIAGENLHLLSENRLEAVIATLEKQKPELVAVDSAQVFASSAHAGLAGSITQTRAVAEQLMRYAKTRESAVILIGHVNKSGDLAGPKVLEHLVDTVLYLEGDRYQQFRILRTLKNRFGATSEIGVFEMENEGMKEVANPSQAFLEGRKKDAVGLVITATIEGTRPFLVEVQALTTTANYHYPKRTASGADINRMQLLIAVLTKHARVKLGDQDVYVNVTGGFKIEEPATDLAAALAIASSRLEKPMPENTIVLGEIGLSGEVRPVPHLELRLKEAERLGFTQAVVPKMKKKIVSKIRFIEISDVSEIRKVL